MLTVVGTPHVMVVAVSVSMATQSLRGLVDLSVVETAAMPPVWTPALGGVEEMLTATVKCTKLSAGVHIGTMETHIHYAVTIRVTTFCFLRNKTIKHSIYFFKINKMGN